MSPEDVAAKLKAIYLMKPFKLLSKTVAVSLYDFKRAVTISLSPGNDFGLINIFIDLKLSSLNLIKYPSIKGGTALSIKSIYLLGKYFSEMLSFIGTMSNL